jgi:hypothetical protein
MAIGPQAALRVLVSVALAALAALACRSTPISRSTRTAPAGGGGASPAAAGRSGTCASGSAGALAGGRDAGGDAGGEARTTCDASTRGAPTGWVPQLLAGSHCVYVPPSRAALPGALTWQDCSAKAASLTSCREIAITWPTDGANATGGSHDATVESDGTVVLQLRNIYEDHASNLAAAMDLVTPADGTPRQAFWDPYDDPQRPSLWLLGGGVGGGKSAWSLYDYESDPNASPRYAGLGGSDTERVPSLLFGLERGRGVPRPGGSYFAETSANLHVWGWDGGDAGAIAQTQSINVPRWAGDTLYFSRELPIASDVWLWTRATGAVALRAFGDDLSRAAAQLGTDGTDLVWIEGSERDPGDVEGPYPTRSIYTASFTTDPSKLEPRRLRAWEPQSITSTYPPAVGCGKALFFAPRPGNAQDPSGVFRDLLLVRLADGVAWKIESPAAYQFDTAWDGALAVTCSEVFATAGLNVRRVRIDSLGDGASPD